MEPTNREKARAELVALTLPPAILKVFDLEPPRALIDYLRDPREIFDLDARDLAAYPPGHLTPLFADITGYTQYAFRHGAPRGGFVRFLLEQPGSASLDGVGWDAVLVPTMVTVFEDREDRAHTAAVAALLGFSAVDALISGLTEHGGRARRSYEAMEAWQRSFVKSLPAPP